MGPLIDKRLEEIDRLVIQVEFIMLDLEIVDWVHWNCLKENGSILESGEA